jgi:hypothetical protein
MERIGFFKTKQVDLIAHQAASEMPNDQPVSPQTLDFVSLCRPGNTNLGTGSIIMKYVYMPTLFKAPMTSLCSGTKAHFRHLFVYAFNI